MGLPQDHPQRQRLNDEVHARPPEPLLTPSRLSYLALFADREQRGRDQELLTRLAADAGVAPPPADANHFSADLGAFRLKWERHTEFSRYRFVVDGPVPGDDLFSDPPIRRVPEDWLARLPGEVMLAAHAVLLPHPQQTPQQTPDLDLDRVAADCFAGQVLVGSAIAEEGAVAVTDFRIREDGFTRLLVFNRHMTAQQSGRMLQRLLEIDTYRLMALLALPAAQSLAPLIGASENELAAITSALVEEGDTEEPVLLDRLTRLEATIQSREAEHQYRFGAAAAYYALVQRRIDELREVRLNGVQTFQEFTERRLAPAMNTCRSVADRQRALAQQLARSTQLLSTRVDIARQKQNQALLSSMNRRAELQLRLQQTVEGLSVAAITYYVVGLVSYAIDGVAELGIPLNRPLWVAISIPLVILVVAVGVSRIRRAVNRRRAA